MEVAIGLAGLLLGVALGWLLRQARAGSALASETSRADNAEAELRVLREQSSQYEKTAKLVSQEVLAETTKQLREELDEQRKRDREATEKDAQLHSERLENLVKPVREKLDAFDKKVSEAETKRAKLDGEFAQKLAELGINVSLLGTRTSNLVDALKKPNVRGAWGELQLRSVIERADMTSYCTFEEQTTTTDSEGRRLRRTCW